MLFQGWMESLGVRGTVAMIRHLAGRSIQITCPRSQERLKDRQELPLGGVTYSVRGILKKLPAGHQIWLLRENEIDKKFWPQCDVVQFDPTTGKWDGRINDREPDKFVKIIAVVAPPTSQQLFRYYCKVGEKTRWEPLDEIPSECVNRAHVQGGRWKPGS
jgi:hypothetical protein